MAKNATPAQLLAASLMLEDGQKQKVVLQTYFAKDGTVTTEDEGDRLNYSQVWLFHTRRLMDPAEFITAEEGSAEWMTAIADARHADQSWGYIAVRCNAPESRVRRAYEEKTGIRSEGLRIAHGGRFLSGDLTLYLGVNQKAGTAIPTAENGGLRGNAPTYVNAIDHLPTEEIRRRLRLLGLKFTGSRKVIAARLDEALQPA